MATTMMCRCEQLQTDGLAFWLKSDLLMEPLEGLDKSEDTV